MMKMKRNKAPQFLKDKKNEWTKQYIATGKWNTKWYGKHEKLLQQLKLMTVNHCAFCDDLLFPLVGEIGQVEHFRPKENYKYLAFAWANLYPICDRCNKTKNKRFSKLLLRPDEKRFEFFDWFLLDTSTFELKPAKIGNPDWKRAQKAIELYGLNKEDKTIRRKIVHNEIKKNKYQNKDEQPFRFM